MFLSLRGALLASIAGALAGVASLVFAVASHPAVSVEMDRDLRGTLSGFSGVERDGQTTFAWTSASAAFRLPGLDRTDPWTCQVRLRGARAAGLQQPLVEIGADGITLSRYTATNDYHDVEVTVPPQPSRDGLTLTIASTPTFVPGPEDRRELGVQVDRIACRPTGRRVVLPPGRALLTSAISGAAFGAAFGATAPSVLAAAGGSILLAAAQAVPLAAGPALFHVYQERAASLALWIAALLVLVIVTLQRFNRAALTPHARFAILFSGAVLFLQLLSLLNPLKDPVDVVFHAHRFQAVLAGNYFFTQPMPSGVRFPYAIALYVFAAPWSWLTQDHVTLLRVVVSTCHVFAGAMLYVVIVRYWQDGIAASLSVVLFHLVPLSYVVIGNANMTYAFGQSAAVVTLAAAAGWRLASRDVLQAIALFVLSAIAFLSHVGVFPVLFAAMLGTGMLYRWFGGRQLRSAAWWVVLMAVAAALFSVAIYYGRFSEAYRTLDRVRGKVAAVEAPQVPADARTPAPASVPRPRRLLRAFSLLEADVGWPILLLAVVGAWRLTAIARNNRLTLVIWAMGSTYVAFLIFSVTAPVEPRMQRYADEFISRIDYMTMPMIAATAALGASWAWRTGAVLRGATALVLLAAVWLGIGSWLRWTS